MAESSGGLRGEGTHFGPCYKYLRNGLRASRKIQIPNSKAYDRNESTGGPNRRIQGNRRGADTGGDAKAIGRLIRSGELQTTTTFGTRWTQTPRAWHRVAFANENRDN